MASSIKITCCLLISVAVSCMSIHGLVEGRTITTDKLIKHKHAIKTIKGKGGDIIDCVEIYKQPAFDHPLLKNHKIQMKPNSFPKGMTTMSFKIEQAQPQLTTVDCPEGTIPILRTRKMVNIHSNAPSSNGTTAYGFRSTSMRVEEASVSYINTDDNGTNKSMGLEGHLNIWNPKVELNIEASGSYMWAQTGLFNDADINVAGSGWMVNPTVFGDNQTRLGIFWTKDNFVRTGCYNLLCAGFVQTSSKTYLGAIFPDAVISQYNDTKHQYSIYLKIFQEKGTGIWWFVVKDDKIGYWPSSIFTKLANGADSLSWGGRVLNSRKYSRHTLTEMGSGHFPNEGFSRASFIGNIKVVDSSYVLGDPQYISNQATNKGCYNLKSKMKSQMGILIYFGGTGIVPTCLG